MASLYDLSARTIDGADQPLSLYRGKVALVVNTASECGFTPQYKGLQELWLQYKDRGLVVLGFPSNEFGGQEPGGAAEIKKFCELKYRVTFPMFDKVKTKGDGQSPVYAYLTRDQGTPKWNFHKYLVGRDGQVIDSFSSITGPDAGRLRSAIEKALDAADAGAR